VRFCSLTLMGWRPDNRIPKTVAGQKFAGEIEGTLACDCHESPTAISSLFGSIKIERDYAQIKRVSWEKFEGRAGGSERLAACRHPPRARGKRITRPMQ
jgi:hypothetical protein